MAGRSLAVVAVACSAALAACQSAQQPGSTSPGGGPTLEAKLVASGGSSVTGAAVMRAYDGGVIMTVNFNGAGPGEFRVAVHANGNCSSPNAFSAGPPWAPPGVTIASPTVFKNDESASLSVRLPGYRIDGPDGVSGRSVVVHSGARDSLDAQPGVPNGRIACGVIGTPRSLLAPFT